MKVNRRRKKKSKIRTVNVPAGRTASELIKALKRDKYFARLDKQGRIVTNAPL